MKPTELDYKNLQGILRPYVAKGRSESASFLNWFLENIYRLDETDADDAICDKPNDKGIDGLHVDHVNTEIHVFQGKVIQNPKRTLGDADLKEFSGSIAQISTKRGIERVLAGNANEDLKKILRDNNVAGLVQDGYKIVGVFLCNMIKDANAEEYLGHAETLIAYDKNRIAVEYVDLDAAAGVNGSFQFSVEDAAPLVYSAGEAASLFLFPALATELVMLGGIADQSLFSQNVRLSLGNTQVNRDIATSIENKREHLFFPLYHNGITMLAESVKYDDGKHRLKIKDYVVVNGAQSLTSLFRGKDDITKDLRILLRIVDIKNNRDLSNKITQYSNNQNAIKPRDLRSNHQLQLRLKAEFERFLGGKYAFIVKRGEGAQGEEISNEDAGRALLAFDVGKPWSCHQIYKVFDDEYSDTFGRKEVTPARIVFLNSVMELIGFKVKDGIENKPFANYRLTRYFVLYVTRELMSLDVLGQRVRRSPEILFEREGDLDRFLEIISYLLDGMILDINHEVQELGDKFDYKADLKSPQKVDSLKNTLVTTYEKDIARKKADAISVCWSDLCKKGKVSPEI